MYELSSLYRKQGVIRKVLHKKDKVKEVTNTLQLSNINLCIQEDDEIDQVCVGESGASPPAERKEMRRSRRKNTAQEVVSYVEPLSPDDDDDDADVS